MTELLSRLFDKNHQDAQNPAVRTAYGTMVSITGIVLNLILFTAKFVVGSLFGAISIVGDAVNNLSDAGTQIISLISFRIAAVAVEHQLNGGAGGIFKILAPKGQAVVRGDGHLCVWQGTLLLYPAYHVLAVWLVDLPVGDAVFLNVFQFVKKVKNTAEAFKETE